MHRRAVRLIPMVLAAIGLAGCRGHDAISAPQNALRSADVVGEAARALDASGHFVLPNPRTTSFPEISGERAKVLAVAYLGEYGPFFLPHLEGQHGGAIDLATVAPCGNVFYAATSYDDASLSRASLATRRAIGPHWLVSFCSASSEPVISVGVSALATDEKLESGPIRLRRPGANSFAPSAIPRGLRGFPMAPEDAALMAARATGRRVAAVPELVMRGVPFGPQLAQWKVTLDAPVTIRGSQSGTRSVRQAVFAGFTRSARSPLGVFVKRDLTTDATTILEFGGAGAGHPLTLHTRADAPVIVEPFAVERR